MRQVWAVLGVWEHIQAGHEGQFDVARGRELATRLLSEPEYILGFGSSNALRFVGAYDGDHPLILGVKALSDELWLATMFITNNERLPRMLRKALVLYRR